MKEKGTHEWEKRKTKSENTRQKGRRRSKHGRERLAITARVLAINALQTGISKVD